MGTDVTRSARDVKRMFSHVAPYYDFLNSLFSFRLHARWRRITVRHTLLLKSGLDMKEHVVSRMPRDLRRGISVHRDADYCVTPRSRMRVLDVCAGSGDMGLSYGEVLQNGSFIVGVDFSGPMLRLARTKSQTARKSLRLVEGDGTALPFLSETFDIVAIAFGLRNIRDIRLALAEMYRVLVPGGCIAILEFSLPSNPVLRRVYSFYLGRVIPAVGRALSGSDAYSYLARSVVDFATSRDVTAALGEGGFVDLRALPLTFGTVTLYTGRKPVL